MLISSVVGRNHNTDVSVQVIQLPAVFRRVRVERLGCHWTDFYWIWHLCIFRKCVEKIQVSLNSDKNNECLTCRLIHILSSFLAEFFLEREMFQTHVVGKTATHISCSVTFFWKSCPLWDNVENIVERGRTQITIWRFRVAFWIPKATDTLSEYVRLSVSHCNSGYANALHCYVIVHCLSC